METADAVQAARELRDRADADITPEEKQIKNQFESVMKEDGDAFHRLAPDLPAGIVTNTIYVENTPGNIRRYGPFLSRLSLRSSYLLGLLWLFKHPLFAVRVPELPRLMSIRKRGQFHLAEEMREFLALCPLPPEEEKKFDSMLSETLTLGSTHLLVVDEVAYTPLWPVAFVSEEGRMGRWGSAVLKKGVA